MAKAKDDKAPADGALDVSGKAPAGAERFESMLEELEKIVQRLEKGELPLEESLQAYEQGIALVRQAQGRLDAMDKKLEQLGADGKVRPAGDAP